jgi:dolichol kinase
MDNRGKSLNVKEEVKTMDKGKSLEGTVAGMGATFLVLLLIVPVPGALIIAVITGIIEMFSPVDDIPVIPVSICILLTAVPVLL